MNRQTTKRLAISLLGAGAALVLAEIVLRLFFAPYVTQIYRIDEQLLHTLIPDTSKYFVHHPINGGGQVLVEIDGDGFRAGRTGGRARVAVFGDSCVLAEFSEVESSFAGRLGAELGASGPVDVVNAGVVAYGPDQACLRMARRLPALAADLVVLVVFADNDFGDLLRNKLFRLGDAGELVANEFRIGDELRAKFGEGLGSTALYRFAKKVYRSMRQQRATEAFVAADPAARRAAAIGEVERWIAGCEHEYRGYVVERNDEVRFLFEDHFDSDVAVAPDSESARYKVRLLGAVLGRAAEVAGANGARLLVVALPSPFVLCGPDHGGVVDPERHPDFDPRGMTRAVANLAAARGIACVDLFETFAANDPDSLYFRAPDNHWNDAGQALAARVVAAFIEERELLDRGDD